MPSSTRTINTGLTGKVNRAILDSVMGQLSDGMWENTPSMAKYWRNAKIAEQDGKLVIAVKDGWDSGFSGKDEKWIKNWFAGKIKETVYDEMNGKQWDRNDKTTSSYLSRSYGEDPATVTVSDAYKAYEILKGRNLKNRYAEPSAPEPSNPPAPAAESIVDKMLEDADDTVILRFNNWNMQDRLYETSTTVLRELKSRVLKNGVSDAWKWFTELGSDVVNDIDNDDVENDYFLDFSNPIESVNEWTDLLP